MLYLNLDGAEVRYGASDSAAGTSFIVPRGQARRLPAFDAARFGVTRAAAEKALLAQLARAYAGYDVAVTAQRPSGDYTELVVTSAGPSSLGLGRGVAGIAPLDRKNQDVNDLAFVFAGALDALEQVGLAAIHEAGHTFGLEHLARQQDFMDPAVDAHMREFGAGLTFETRKPQDEPALLRAALGEAGKAPVLDASRVVKLAVPKKVVAGAWFDAKVTFENTGARTWSAASGDALAALGEAWTGAGGALPAGVKVAPGQQVELAMRVRAASRTGTYRLQWQLMRAGAVFGAKTAAANVTVVGGLTGGVTAVGQDFVTGWVLDKERPSRVVTVTVYVDGEYLGRVRAGTAAPAGSGAGAHGFRIVSPRLDPGAHTTEAWATDATGQRVRIGEVLHFSR